MSMYNAIFGVNELAPLLFELLGLKPDNFYRFRDAYLNEEGLIAVYTRAGGGNREDGAAHAEAIRKHPWYLRDRDDDFDRTYSTFFFQPCNEAKVILDSMTEDASPPPAAKFKKLLDDMQTKSDSPETRRALEVGKKIFGAIQHADSEGRPVIVVDGQGNVKSEKL